MKRRTFLKQSLASAAAFTIKAGIASAQVPFAMWKTVSMVVMRTTQAIFLVATKGDGAMRATQVFLKVAGFTDANLQNLRTTQAMLVAGGITESPLMVTQAMLITGASAEPALNTTQALMVASAVGDSTVRSTQAVLVVAAKI